MRIKPAPSAIQIDCHRIHTWPIAWLCFLSLEDLNLMCYWWCVSFNKKSLCCCSKFSPLRCGSIWKRHCHVHLKTWQPFFFFFVSFIIIKIKKKKNRVETVEWRRPLAFSLWYVRNPILESCCCWWALWIEHTHTTVLRESSSRPSLCINLDHI